MFRKETKLDNEGLRRMREAIRQRIDQDDPTDGNEETAATESHRYPTVPVTNQQTEPSIAPPSSYEPLSRTTLPRLSGGWSVDPATAAASATDLTLPTPGEPGAPIPARNTPDTTVVAQGTAWRGRLHSTEDIHIEGLFEGEIKTAKRLYIAAQARVEANVQATEIIVLGQLNGQIQCQERLEIHPAGQVSGQIDAGRFVVHEGASLGGQVRMRSTTNTGSTPDNTRPTLQRVR